MPLVNRFAQWLSQTPPSRMLQTYEWMVPTIQSVHIVAIGVVLAAVLMLVLRIFGVAWRDHSVADTHARFGPWLTGGLVVLLLTGLAMIVGEPPRELLALSFWLKMLLVAVGAGLVAAFRRSLRRHGARWDTAAAHDGRTRVLAVLTLLVWCAAVVLGRLIAYDYVWGSWSAGLKG
jgi:hypothetical protein